MSKTSELIAESLAFADPNYSDDPRWQTACAVIETLAAALEKVQEDHDDLDRSFMVRWEADMRAIKRWQDAGPGRALTWPDHADMVVWLLEQLDALSTAQGEVEAVERERDEAYVVMIDTGGFLRGYGDAAEVAARRLVQAVPDSFDDREDAVRAALVGLHEGEET